MKIIKQLLCLSFLGMTVVFGSIFATNITSDDAKKLVNEFDVIKCLEQKDAILRVIHETINSESRKNGFISIALLAEVVKEAFDAFAISGFEKVGIEQNFKTQYAAMVAKKQKDLENPALSDTVRRHVESMFSKIMFYVNPLEHADYNALSLRGKCRLVDLFDAKLQKSSIEWRNLNTEAQRAFVAECLEAFEAC